MHVLLVFLTFLGIHRIFVARGAAGKECALFRMGAGYGAITDTVAIGVEVAPVALHFFQLLCVQNLAAIVTACIVPSQWRRHVVIHAQIEIGHENNGGLQPLCQVKGQCTEIEALPRRGREQQHLFGITVRGISGGQYVGLLRAGRHAGGRPGSLHVEPTTMPMAASSSSACKIA